MIEVTGLGDGEESFVFAALRTPRGWHGADELAYVYNPGMGGMYEELYVGSITLEQAIPDGPPELVVRFTHTRSDTDLGIGEWESSDTRVLSICGLRGDAPTCFTHFPFASRYTRDVLEDADVDPELVSDDLPIESHYTLEVSLSPPGHLTARFVEGELEESERWMVGRHRIEELAQRPRYEGRP